MSKTGRRLLELSNLQDPSKNEIAKSRDRQREIALAHWGLSDISQYSDLYAPTHRGFFAGNEKLPSVLLDTLKNPNYLAFAAKEFLGVELLPMQALIIKEIWERPFPMLVATRGGSKSFCIAVYSLLRCLLCTNVRVVIIGAAFRQSKFVFEYAERIWFSSPLFRNMCGTGKEQGPHRTMDKFELRVGLNTLSAMPIGDGQKIRGMRATDIIADEFPSIPVEIYENVVAGFASVSATPIDNVKQIARRKKLIEISDDNAELGDLNIKVNKAVICGSAYFTFNHFYEYWERYSAIIRSKGDKNKLEQIFKGEVPEGFDWKHYSIIRIPYDLFPEGFMEQIQIARSKATVHSGIFNVEFGACWAKDSAGFFKRTLIESCVVKHDGLKTINGENILFRATTRGSSAGKYVYAIDPASESDNFCIIVLEVLPTHRRIVYCWTTTRQKHTQVLNKQLTVETDFYAFCARKVRQLMQTFPCTRIALDKQGGGVAVEEALHNKNNLMAGELAIWPVIDDEKEKPTDMEQGLHILEIINFSKADWVNEANHGLKKDFEDKILLFPFFDPLVIGEAASQDEKSGTIYDTLEDCVFEIEELKDELMCIQHTQTPNGRDKWDTPEIKLPGNKKGRQRKDRYTALLMANSVARNLDKVPPSIQNVAIGGFVGQQQLGDNRNIGGKPFSGPEWFEKAAQQAYF